MRERVGVVLAALSWHAARASRRARRGLRWWWRMLWAGRPDAWGDQ